MERLSIRNQRVSGAIRLGVIAVAIVLASDPVGLRSDEAQAAAEKRADQPAARTVSNQDRASDDGAYHPEETYQGVYAPSQLYRIVFGTDTWAGSRRPARVNQITCRDARTALEQRGFWRGQLSVTGACESGEPTEWATGNFLNFQTNRHHEDTDL